MDEELNITKNQKWEKKGDDTGIRLDKGYML